MAVDFDFEKAGRNFISRRLDPFKQMAVLKRVIPLVGPLIPLMLTASKENVTQQDALTALEQFAPGLAAGVATLKDEDVTWLMETCLQTLRMEDQGTFVPFWNKGARKSMFEDMADLSVYLPLTIEVIKENLRPFFLTTVTKSSAPTATTAA